MKYIKAFFRRIYALMVRFPLAAATAALLVVAAVTMKLLGFDIQIGGFLDKLFGRKPDRDVKVLPPKDRTDSDGNLIPLGKPDDRGYIQSPVSIEIKPPGIFSNPDTITVVKPDKSEIVLPLPTGVKNKDVSEIIEVSPNVYQVKNNDSGVDTKELEDILK